MLRYRKALPFMLLLGAVTACDSGRHSSAGFRLAADGDVARGKTAFVEFGCQSCHVVSGVDLPQPTVRPPVPVVLGGVTTREMTDGYLVTSIINPSYRLAPQPKEAIAVAGRSRMPEYADKLTVRQLTDLVAFLQSRYEFRRPIARYPAY